MKSKLTNEQWLEVEMKAEKACLLLERRGFKFLKHTDKHVYAIGPDTYCNVNDKADLKEFLDYQDILKSPWNSNRKELGEMIQRKMVKRAREPKCSAVSLAQFPLDMTLPANQQESARACAYLAACYDHTN